MGAIAYGLVGTIHVTCHGLTSPTDEEWEGYLAHLRENQAEVSALLEFIPEGTDAGPTITHRRAANSLWDEVGGSPPAAILTSSRPGVRAARTLSVIMPPHIGVFGAWELSGVGDHLGSDRGQLRRALSMLGRLAAQLDVELPHGLGPDDLGRGTVH